MRRVLAYVSVFIGLASVAVACAPPSERFTAATQHLRVAKPMGSQVRVPFIAATGDFELLVSVGGGSPVPLVFDEGSAGLHVIKPGVGPKVTITKTTAPPIIYGSGIEYQGYLAYGSVKLDPNVATTTMPMMVVTKISCIQSKPKCPGASGVKGAQKAGQYGAMGVRLDRGVTLDSALSYLPPPLNEGYVASRTALYLGLTPTVRKRFKTIALLKENYNEANGWPAWNVNLPVTWRIKGRRLTSSTIPTLFDTGVTDVRLVLPSGTIPRSEVANGLLATGLPVSARIANVLDFDFTSGRSAGTNQVLVRVTPKPFANTGWAPFDSYDVLYDPIHGLMGFAPRPFPSIRPFPAAARKVVPLIR